MKLLTYFVFTLLSVVIQFCVMDFIQEKVEINEKPISLNETIERKGKITLGILKDHTGINHALYYRVNKNRDYEDSQAVSEIKYMSSSLDNFSPVTTTEPSSFTVFDELYDENVSVIHADFTTETFITSTELSNFTDITLFENSSATSRPNTISKTTKDRHMCYCNLMYNQCDIHCCCDNDCSRADKKLFGECGDVKFVYPHKTQFLQQLTCDERDATEFTGFKNLFCIAKTNLPEKKSIITQKIYNAEANNLFLWHENFREQNSNKFERDLKHVWLLNNRSLYFLDLPASVTNNYCSIRRPLKFLSNVNIHCQVKLEDLEMFRILKTFAESSVISAINSSFNSTAVNCSSFHCINWTIHYCDQDDCSVYNKSLHEPVCTGNWCINVALKLEYIFNIYNSKIINATIKFYIENTTLRIHSYATQEISVNFFIGNASLEKIIKLSGNPGYIIGAPVITSFSALNHTIKFYNDTNDNRYLSYADNKGGFCVLSRLTKKVVHFGINQRNKCKFSSMPTSTSNATEACIEIQININKMLSVDRKVFISSYGDPENVKDDDWLPITPENVLVYGEFQSQNSKLNCFNLQARVAFIFTYIDLSQNVEIQDNKLLSARVESFKKNVTFSTERPSTVITVDINFINVNMLTRPMFAGAPYLHPNLPKDFFFPFPSNECSITKRNLVLIKYLCIITLLSK